MTALAFVIPARTGIRRPGWAWGTCGALNYAHGMGEQACSTAEDVMTVEVSR